MPCSSTKAKRARFARRHSLKGKKSPKLQWLVTLLPLNRKNRNGVEKSPAGSRSIGRAGAAFIQTILNPGCRFTGSLISKRSLWNAPGHVWRNASVRSSG